MPDDIWGGPDGGNSRRRKTRAPKAALTATRGQRLRYVCTSRLAKATAVVTIAAVLTGGALAYRAPLTDAYRSLTGNSPEPTIIVSAAPTLNAADRDELIELGSATANLKSGIEDATTELADTERRPVDYAPADLNIDPALLAGLTDARQDAHSAVLASETILASGSATSAQLNSAAGELATALEHLRTQEESLTAAVDAAQKAADEAKAKEKADKKAEQDAKAKKKAKQAPATPSKTTSPKTPKPTSPKPTKTTAPKPTSPKSVSQSRTVSCSGDATVTFTASGGGTVKLTSGGKSASGNGSASVTVSTSGKVTATATATGSISLASSWSGSCV